MSYESTAEPIKVGYLMDFTLPPGFPEVLQSSFTQTFDLVFDEARQQGVLTGSLSTKVAWWFSARTSLTTA